MTDSKGVFIYYIYIVENLINGKSYIGQTADPDFRWRKHRKADFACPYLHRAIRKYGQKNFDFVLIERCETLEEAYEREVYWIAELNTLSPNGYNLKEGGLGGGLDSFETRQKKSQSKLGVKNSFYGRKHSKESKEKIKQAKIGVKLNVPVDDRERRSAFMSELNRSRLGQKLSEEHRKNIGLSQVGRSHSEETKRKMAAARRNWWAKRKTAC